MKELIDKICNHKATKPFLIALISLNLIIVSFEFLYECSILSAIKYLIGINVIIISLIIFICGIIKTLDSFDDN